MRTAAIGIGLFALGLAVGALIVVERRPEAPAERLRREAAPTVRDESQLERRLKRLSARLAEEAGRRAALEARLEQLAVELAALSSTEAAQSLSPPPTAATTSPVADAVVPAGTTRTAGTASNMEQALLAAGVDARTAEDIRRRRDELTLAEMFLRDQATREQWLDTPRFAEEMAAIEAQRSSIRDEIGDDAYDRYLAAAGETNRVTVDEVMVESPAALAGLQPGDLVLRYGGVRIFAPADLVAETRGGIAGERVRVHLLRNGERIEIDVARGPLGLRIAGTQAPPGDG